jgi:dolichol-phosphate mannosyltransferase
MGDVELAVIAPCLNEELNVDPLVDRTLAAFSSIAVPCELVLVDDGSRDGTWSRIEARAAASPRVRGVRHEKNRGIVGAWLSGLAATSAALVCLIDSDLQNRPEDVPRLYETFARTKADVVQAVRHPKQGMERMVFSRGLNLILNATFGMRLRDNKSGFLLCRRETLRELLVDAPGYRYFQGLIGAAAGVRGMSVVEVDTEFDARAAGESFLSKFPVKVSLRLLGEVVRYRLDTLARPRR